MTALLNNLSIRQITDLATVDWLPLLRESQVEGFRFLQRLQGDFETGDNRFDKPGEVLYMVFTAENKVVGIGGVNAHAGSATAQIGRLRRFYIAPTHRRQGLGNALLAQILCHAQAFFDEMELYTDTEAASQFYSDFGFARATDSLAVTHRLNLKDFFANR